MEAKQKRPSVKTALNKIKFKKTKKERKTKKMNNKNKDFFISDVAVNVGEEEIILASPTELIEEAKEIAQNTKFDEKFPFALQYNANQKEFLLSMIKTAGAIVEDDDEEGHVLATMMNMTQLAFIKQLDCVERVKTDEGTNPFLAKEAIDLAQIKQEQQKDAIVDGETQKIVTDINSRILNVQSATLAETEQVNDDVAVASVGVSARCSCNNQPTNTDWDSARDITIETWVSGSLCCPGIKQWFKFTVPETKEYTIYTTGSMDTEGELYDHNHNRIDDETTNIKIDGRLNLRIRCVLYVGVTYYICVSDAKDNTGSYTLKVTSQILAEKVDVLSNRSDGIVVLERGKTYQLPRGEGYDFLNITGVENAPLSVKVNPSTTADKRVYWSASFIPTDHVDVAFNTHENDEIYQAVTAHTCGGTKLCAWDWFERGKRGEMTVAVIPNGGSLKKVTGISLDHTTLILDIDEYQEIVATVSPADASVTNVEWISDDPNIATVNPYGRVEAIAPGTTKIRARSMTGTPVKEAVCIVTVKGFYNIVNTETGKAANIYGSYLLNLSDGMNINLYEKSGSNEQVWKIDKISNSEACYIRSYVDQDYGFNAHHSSRGNYNCNIHEIAGNETDAAVHFVLQNDGSYKIKLANYSNYYLTADDSDDSYDIRWQPEDNEKNQHWNLVDFGVQQRDAEKTEYHIVPYSDIDLGSKRALQVDMNTPNEGDLVNKTFRLANDEPLELATFSYVNKQKWLIKNTGTACQICTAHGDNYRLCKKSDAVAYVSDDDSYESSITVEKYDASQNLVMIKLTSSNLYLTVSNTGIIWSSPNNNLDTQLWQVIAKANNIHNGADSAARLYNASSSNNKDKTARAYKLGNEEFVARYYADAGEILNIDKILSVKEVESLKGHKLEIVSVYQDSSNYASYFNASEGEKDAIVALSLAKERNQTAGSAIYFAVDYDASYGEMTNIKAYFSAIKSVFDNADVKYKIGVYGNGLTCSTIKGLYAEYSWLNCSTGHHGYSQYDSPDKYNIKQAEQIVYNNITFDDDIAVGDNYGQW